MSGQKRIILSNLQKNSKNGKISPEAMRELLRPPQTKKSKKSK